MRSNRSTTVVAYSVLSCAAVAGIIRASENPTISFLLSAILMFSVTMVAFGILTTERNDNE